MCSTYAFLLFCIARFVISVVIIPFCCIIIFPPNCADMRIMLGSLRSIRFCACCRFFDCTCARLVSRDMNVEEIPHEIMVDVFHGYWSNSGLAIGTSTVDIPKLTPPVVQEAVSFLRIRRYLRYRQIYWFLHQCILCVSIHTIVDPVHCSPTWAGGLLGLDLASLLKGSGKVKLFHLEQVIVDVRV